MNTDLGLDGRHTKEWLSLRKVYLEQLSVCNLAYLKKKIRLGILMISWFLCISF